jgi:peptidyl-prolyl cis-trans isomerase A (cyclophilin A)
MRIVIAELAKKRGVLISAAAVTAGLAAWTLWPHAKAPVLDAIEPMHGCEQYHRHHHHHHQMPAELVAPPTANDVWTFIDRLPTRNEKVDFALPRATIETSEGTLHCALFPQVAPVAVASFIGLATGQLAWWNPKTGAASTEPFYDGLTFHRVIPGFVIQGGDPVGNGTGGPGYTFADELTADLPMEPGTLAMANRGRDTNGSQFFITDGAPAHLRGTSTIFGMCEELDVVHRIASVPTSGFDKPATPVVIQHVSVTQY